MNKIYKKFRRISPYVIGDNNKLEIDNKDLFFNALLNYFDKTNWVHANPAYYEKSKSFQKRLNNIYFKNKIINENIEKLSNFIISPNKDFIFIFGRRGSGKTFFQNYYLNTKTYNFLFKNNYTWVRVDFTKIYEYNNSVIYSKKIDFFQYLWAQLLYVYIRYREEHIYIKKEKKTLYGKKMKEYVEKHQNIDNEKKFQYYAKDNIWQDIEIKNVFINWSKEDINNFIQPIKDEPNEGNSLSSKPFLKENIKKLAFNLLSEVHKNKKKIVLIVDGIDNIDFSNKSREDINDTLKRLIERQQDINSEYKFDKIIISARSELDLEYTLMKNTIQDSQYENTPIYTTEHFKYEDFWVSFLSQLTYSDIKKLKEFLEVDLDNEKIKKLLGANYNKDKLKNFIFYVVKLSDVIESYFKKDLLIDFREDLGLSKDENFCILKHLYDNDAREMKNSILKSFQYIINFINNSYYKKSQNSFQMIMKNKKSIVLEAIFKNGSRYAPDIRDKKYVPPYYNLGFTNIFNPSEEIVSGHIIPPLIFLYILRLLSLNNEGLRTLDIINILSKNINKSFQDKLFSSLKNYIQKALDHILEYNYIEYTAFNEEEFVNITIKGKIVLHTIFKDINVLHANIYYASIYEELDLVFSAYNSDGKFYVTKTIENVAQYLYFLEILQKDMLIKNSNLKLEIITPQLINSFRALYMIDGKNIKLSSEVVQWLEERILSGIIEIINILENIKRADKLIEFVQSKKIKLTDKERLYIVLEWLHLSLKIDSKSDSLYYIDSNKDIKDFVNINEYKKLKSYIDNFNSENGYQYIKKLSYN